MTNKMKTTAPVSSVGADGEQPNNKNHTEIKANETAKNNLQATKRGNRSSWASLPTMWLWGSRCGIIPSEKGRFCTLHWKMTMQGFSGGCPLCSAWRLLCPVFYSGK